MKNSPRFQPIAEAIKKPLAGQIAWHKGMDSTAIYDGELWIKLEMPVYMFTFKDLNKETQRAILKWISETSPQFNPKEIANRFPVMEFSYGDIIAAADMATLVDFFE